MPTLERSATDPATACLAAGFGCEDHCTKLSVRSMVGATDPHRNAADIRPYASARDARWTLGRNVGAQCSPLSATSGVTDVDAALDSSWPQANQICCPQPVALLCSVNHAVNV
jgi:hypothetical protein